jgi:hypothetical protein
MTEQENIELQKQYEAKIQELTNENLALKTQAEESKNASAVKEATAAAQTRPAAAPSAAAQDHQRAKVIQETGGLAHYVALPMDVRLRANGQRPASQEECELSRKLFGRNSSSIEAARLARQNPSQYSRLRAIHREL